MSYCHTNVSGLHHPSTLENKTSNGFFYKTTGPTVLKFHMEHDLTPGSQNFKIGSGWISKMATVTKNSKNNKINFFPRTTGYFWLNFGIKYQWNIGIQKNLLHSFVTVTYFLFTSVILLQFVCLKIKYLNNQTIFCLKPFHQLLSNFTRSIIRFQGLRIVELGQVEYPRWPPLRKIAKITQLLLQNHWTFLAEFWYGISMKHRFSEW